MVGWLRPALQYRLLPHIEFAFYYGYFGVVAPKEVEVKNKKVKPEENLLEQNFDLTLSFDFFLYLIILKLY